MARRDAGIDLEREFWEDGRVVVGIDEVGKGSWAGPLMVGAVVIPTGDRLPGVRDSKAMTERARESIFDELADWCSHWSFGVVSATECDTLGMSAAQRLACRRALEGLGVEVDVAISDGRWDFVSPLVPEVVMRVGADADSLSVAAASVLAKVTRDREMRALAQHHPGYSFQTNKGYPCHLHRAGLAWFGPSVEHRRSWSFMDSAVPWTGSPRLVAEARLF
ncbi:MAG: ribonuclease HII [Ilumatobacteraceae bacterium]|nr:ribonuclease HII [Ilumatobacteraceae bacterium]MBL6760447.1 ribonuclease HII [Ilumatobacteraceae bacterium]